MASLDKEEWRLIDWIKTSVCYEVSNLGNVRQVTSDVLKATHVCKKGFKKVQLQIKNHKNNRCSYSIHNLVARAFIPDCSPRKTILFLDGDKGNCRADNLALKYPNPLRDSFQLAVIRNKRARRRLYNKTIKNYSRGR
jgi:hypothetical protein